MTRYRRVEVSLDSRGRIVIPAALRQALGIHTGDTLLAHVEEGQLILEARKQVLSWLKDMFADVPPGVSLADELIAERRAEARREEEACTPDIRRVLS